MIKDEEELISPDHHKKLAFHEWDWLMVIPISGIGNSTNTRCGNNDPQRYQASEDDQSDFDLSALIR